MCGVYTGFLQEFDQTYGHIRRGHIRSWPTLPMPYWHIRAMCALAWKGKAAQAVNPLCTLNEEKDPLWPIWSRLRCGIEKMRESCLSEVVTSLSVCHRCVLHSYYLKCINTHAQAWPEPYKYAVYDRIFGDFPAKNTVYTPYIYNSGQPCTRSLLQLAQY
jgi:hypothetical protein